MPDPENPSPPDPRLEELRREIDAVDAEIVRQLKRRQEVVQEVLERKKARRLPVYHPAREENLISRLRSLGRAQGLDPDYLEDIFRRIMRQSRLEQSVRLARRAVRPGARVLVVGGRGAMGSYFARWFETSGYGVHRLDRDDWDLAPALCRGVDLALVAVPIAATGPVVRQLAPHLPREALLADLTSVKEAPLAAMLAAHPGPVLGLHPLFGPTPASLDKQIVIATPGRRPESGRWLLEQLAAWGAVVVPAEAREHDEAMEVVQALRHFATFAFGHFLHRRRVDLARLLEFSSPIYRLEFGMVGRLFAQDPALYAEIIFASPRRRELLRDYLTSLTEHLDMVESGDKTVFCERFRGIARWFDPFSEQALRETAFLIDKLIERF